jgi:hypothetical protein
VYKTGTVTVAKAQEGPPVASAGRRVERGLAKRIEQADAWRIVDAVPCTAGWRRPTTAEPGAWLSGTAAASTLSRRCRA